MKTRDWITNLLDRILPPELHHLLGDLEEEYQYQLKKSGKTSASYNFWFQLLRSLPYFFFQSLIWNTEMLYNYLKVTWRNLKKYRVFSLINILGLAASMSVCLLIIVFLADQLSYDRFHPNAEHIVRITSDYKSEYNDESFVYATSPASLGSILKEQFPKVKEHVHIRGNFSGEFKKNDAIVPLEGIYAGPAFFEIFGFELIEGNPQTALQNPGNVLLTPQAVEKIFGSKNPLGETLTGLGDRDYTVTGVIDNSEQSHFEFEVIASFATLQASQDGREMLQDWKSNIYDSYTYLLMDESTDYQEFEASVQSLIPVHYFDESGENVLEYLSVQPLSSINMGPALSNEIGMVMPGIIAWFLVGFAVIIILIASFNYVSLTVARSLNRSKEVGVRKVLGAHRGSVIKQFLFESVLIALLALIFSAFLLRWILPEFNSLFFISFTGNQVEPGLITHPGVILSFVVFSITVGLLAGLYPSWFLSSFSPSAVLKGTSNTPGVSGQTLKKILTVIQFSFSLIFIITSLILYQQFQFMGNTDYGFQQKNIVNVALQDISYEELKYRLSGNPHVESMAASSKVPALSSIDGVWIKNEASEERVNAHSFRVNPGYIETMDLNLMAGRNFDSERASDTTSALIISEEAVKQLNLGNNRDALQQSVKVGDKSYTVIGVIENFISADPLRSGDPIVFMYQPRNYRYAVFKTREGSTGAFIEQLNETWLSVNSLYSLKYKVFDEQLKENPTLVVFGDFIKVLSLIGIFSILISCLGLLGMAMYSAENRVKEIGVRKVLGASVKNIVYLLSGEYIKLIVISVLIGLPLAWGINSLWMRVITNKVGLHYEVFVAGTLGIIVLALVTVGSQALRAARANSIDNLRSE